MPNCTSCGSPIPEGQGSSCSMCMGVMGYGSDGYYEEWARNQYQNEQEQREAERRHEERMQRKNDDELPF